VFLNTVWTFQVLRGMFVWAISVLVSIGIYVAQQFDWVVANTVYAEKLLVWIVPISTLSIVISSFEPTWTSLANRSLQQAKLIKIEILSQIIGVVVMLLLAWQSKSIWSLVIGSLATSATHLLIVSLIVDEKKNRFQLEKSALNEIYHFGKWVFFSSIVGFLINNGDRLLLGGLISTSELGVYSIAAFMVGAVSMVISKLLGNVAYPAISETIRDKPQNLLRVYYRFRMPFDAAVLFLVGFLWLSGQTIIHLLYDARYQNAGWMLNVLGLSLLGLRYNVTDQCYMALGNPKIMTIMIIVRTIAMYALVPIAFKLFGIQGAIWAIVFSNIASFPLSIYYKKSYNLIELKKELITLPMILVGLLSGLIFNKIVSLVLPV
jgi:O-antigen/teichoic acid export membrane protein